jgi:protein-arginine kinase activator protein McsA
MLKKAVAEEDYETAASLRDRIRSMEGITGAEE